MTISLPEDDKMQVAAVNFADITQALEESKRLATFGAEVGAALT